jgi:F-type H+-transporting ATPase subunit delta
VAELVSSRYSEAFFALGQQSGKLEGFAQDARLVLDILEKDAEEEDATLGEFLYHPQISEESKTRVVESVLKGKVNDETLGLVAVVIKKQRERELPAVLEAFIKLVDEYNELAEAHITSAVPIDSGRLETIRGILSEKFGKKIVITTSIDRELIGGFKVLILGNSFDRTIRTSINELTASFNKR